MDNLLLKTLACPFHKDNDLAIDEKEEFLLCEKCARKYEILRLDNEVSIPNFLIKEGDWKIGLRVFKNNFLKSFQSDKNNNFKINFDNTKTVLDVGCGENARGNINLDCYIPKEIPRNFILANAEYLPFKNASIDMVISNYNIEHLINPAIFIQNVYNICKEKVEIITDNSEWLGDFFFRLIGDGRIFHDEHYYKWSVEYFRNLLNRLGLSNNEVFLLNLSSNPIVKSVSFLGRIPRIGNIFFRDLKIIIWKK
jgi:uncharacterized protein YbaR (Trm112 family)